MHTEIRSLDDGGQWDQAVRLATSTDRRPPTARFDAFDTQASATSTR